MSSIINQKSFYFLLLAIVLLSFVNAQDNTEIQSASGSGSYFLNQPALIYQTCGNCTTVNITNIILANRTNITGVIPMNKIGTYYWYMLNASYITSPGNYIINGEHDNNNVRDTWSYEVSITQLAVKQSTSQAVGSAMFLMLNIILMFVFGGMGLRLFKSPTWWILGIFFTFLASLMLIYNTWLGFEYHKLFTGLTDSSTPEWIFWMLLMIIVLGMLVSAALLFLRWKKVLRYVKREIKRKEENDSDLEDWDMDRWVGENWETKGVR